ncbi:MAG: carbon storage regulator CsrA [Pseudomonadota bacterium]
MLVLTRREHESIIIGDGLITITFLENLGDKIRIGIKAPKNISIHRKEIFERIKYNTKTDNN